MDKKALRLSPGDTFNWDGVIGEIVGVELVLNEDRQEVVFQCDIRSMAGYQYIPFNVFKSAYKNGLLSKEHDMRCVAVLSTEASDPYGLANSTFGWCAAEDGVRVDGCVFRSRAGAEMHAEHLNGCGVSFEVYLDHQQRYESKELDLSDKQQTLGFPKALRALRSWPMEHLQAELWELLKQKRTDKVNQKLDMVRQVIREKKWLKGEF